MFGELGGRRWPDRSAAGRALAAELGHLAGRDPVVVGLPRGGVVVAAEVARELGAPLDVEVVRKIGAPGHPELGIGAVATGGVRWINWPLVRRLGITGEEVEELARAELAEVERRASAYDGRRNRPPRAGRTVVVVDDGIATGGTVTAAAHVLRSQDPAALVLAVPVAPPETVGAMAELYDDVVVLSTPRPFLAVGEHYADFRQTTDDEVRALLAEADRRAGRG